MWVVGGARVTSQILALTAALGLSALFVGYSTTTPPPPVTALADPQYGVASWYGPGFNGHSTSSGEIYDQKDLTAASTIYPLGSRVMVTNLDNHRSTEV